MASENPTPACARTQRVGDCRHRPGRSAPSFLGVLLIASTVPQSHSTSSTGIVLVVLVYSEFAVSLP